MIENLKEKMFKISLVKFSLSVDVIEFRIFMDNLTFDLLV